MLDQVSKLESEGYAASYIESIVKAARPWLSHNRIALTVKIKIKGADDTPTLVNERTPTSQELAGILRAGELDARAAAALISFSGVRPEARVDDVEDYIESGWEYVAQLPNGKVIVKQPPTPRV